MAPVAEYLPSLWETLGSNPESQKRSKTKEKSSQAQTNMVETDNRMFFGL